MATLDPALRISAAWRMAAVVGRGAGPADPEAGGDHLEGVLGRLVVELLDVVGDDDAGRRVGRQRGADGPVDEVGQLLGHGEGLDVLVAHVFEQGSQIDLLLVGPAHGRAVGLPDDGQHRHMVQLGVVEAVEKMDGAGPRRGHAHTEVAGELGIAHRLEGGHLLVAGLDELRRGVGLDPRPEYPVDAVPGVGEDLVDAPCLESLQQITRYGLAHRSS